MAKCSPAAPVKTRSTDHNVPSELDVKRNETVPQSSAFLFRVDETRGCATGSVTRDFIQARPPLPYPPQAQA